ncbi:MAG: M28 family peptidase [Clostridium sp.]
MKKNKILVSALVLVVLVFGMMGYTSLYPSKANKTDSTKVRADLQMEHIKNIAVKPHSVFDVENKEEVRDYLLEELRELGLNPQTFVYNDLYEKRSDSKVDIENIYAEIKGKSDSYIMLITHYDSSHAKTERYAEKDGSLGAADAGYALSTILEVLRVVKENNIELENGIKILLTDGEEYGLLGAREAVKNEEIFKGVNYLVNIEARGTKGPAVMFETSPKNDKVIDLYKASENSFSYSITPEIYRFIPNPTDFTVFMENNMTGINISVLDGLENYHTPDDNISNLNYDTMQHYGDQVLGIVSEYVQNEKYSNMESLQGEKDSIFFTIGKTFITYSRATNVAVLLFSIILIWFIYCYKCSIKIKKAFKFIGYSLGYLVTSMCFGYLVSRVLAIINGREFKLTYLPLMKYEMLVLIGVLALVFVGYFILHIKVLRSVTSRNEFVFSQLSILVLFSVIFTLALPGGSYLTMVPLVLLLLSEVIVIITKSGMGYFIPAALGTLLYVPTVYLFNSALTIGALAANVLFAFIGFLILVVCYVGIRDNSYN